MVVSFGPMLNYCMCGFYALCISLSLLLIFHFFPLATSADYFLGMKCTWLDCTLYTVQYTNIVRVVPMTIAVLVILHSILPIRTLRGCEYLQESYRKYPLNELAASSSSMMFDVVRCEIQSEKLRTICSKRQGWWVRRRRIDWACKWEWQREIKRKTEKKPNEIMKEFWFNEKEAKSMNKPWICIPNAQWTTIYIVVIACIRFQTPMMFD